MVYREKGVKEGRRETEENREGEEAGESREGGCPEHIVLVMFLSILDLCLAISGDT